MKPMIAPLLLLLAAPLAGPVSAQQETEAFDSAAVGAQARLDASIAELNALQERIKDEKLPLSTRLSELHAELLEVRAQYDEVTTSYARSNLEVTNLGKVLDKRKEDDRYLTRLFVDYRNQLASRLHIAEEQVYEDVLEAARLAPENGNLTLAEIYGVHADLIAASLERLHDALGGQRFPGTAVHAGTLLEGEFLLLGPGAFFRSADGTVVGTVERRLNSNEPTVFPYLMPEDVAAARSVLEGSGSTLPFDPTLGDARQIEATTAEPFLEHVKKGGAVMWPIFGLAGAALLVALFKWLELSFIRRPSKKRVAELLAAVRSKDETAAAAAVAKIKGPAGRMLQAGVEHIREPRELIEEVMYESVLTTKLKTQRFLPFVAISAASAPLLGLLGTVTGIISTFRLITIFGSGDVRMLSGGISEALITTKFGLIVAIPSLLLHAFLSRKAKSVTNQMETVAVTFANQVSLAYDNMGQVADAPVAAAAPDRAAVRHEVRETLREMLAPQGGLTDNEMIMPMAPEHGRAEGGREPARA